MWSFAWKNLIRRPWRTGLAFAGLSAAIATFASLSSLGNAYEQSLQLELSRMGVQMMLVPIGCPYDAAARVLKGNVIENSLPFSALEQARRDPDVAVAAPLLMAALAREREKRADIWVGLDESALTLKPWWQPQSGTAWFDGTNSVILGAESAEIEMRAPGDLLFSPETGRSFRVQGVLRRSGTSDDSLFFIPLSTAQEMFEQKGRLTAVALRLHDPSQARAVAARLQELPGVQVVTLTEMMGVFLNLLASARSVLQAINLIALTVGGLTIFNTLLAAVVERSGELSVMRAIGASRLQIFTLICCEALCLSMLAALAGLLLVLLMGGGLDRIARQLVPFAPSGPMHRVTLTLIAQTGAVALACGLLAGFYPAWKAAGTPPAAALKES